MPGNHNEIEKRLWETADELRANSKLKASEYSVPVLGLIFLRYVDHRFAQAERDLPKSSSGRREVNKTDYQAKGILYIPPSTRFSTLLKLPEGEKFGKAINDAMRTIEDENEDLRGVLPRTYNVLDNRTLIELLRLLDSIPMTIEGDAFGKIYEYFLGNFAMSEGQKGGEFFTPASIVRLIVEIIEPFHGRIYDPACGSGGMFVQSARFVENHKKNPNAEIMVYGQEKTTETVRLCKMNMAVHGLSGDVREANSYYEDLHDAVGRFDFVMANPPFNVNKVDKDRIKDDTRRFPLGMPTADNANYLWIQLFYSALNERGRAGFVMASSSSDARGSELEIRKKLIQTDSVDVVISIGPNFFYTVTLPCMLWFLDKAKHKTTRRNSILFIDARNTYHQVDRAHRDFTPQQIGFLADVVRLYRGERPESTSGGAELLAKVFPDGRYRDVLGICNVAAVDEVRRQGWSLSPGRYVGIAEQTGEEVNFRERLGQLGEELEELNARARELEKRIAANISDLSS